MRWLSGLGHGLRWESLQRFPGPRAGFNGRQERKGVGIGWNGKAGDNEREIQDREGEKERKQEATEEDPQT